MVPAGTRLAAGTHQAVDIRLAAGTHQTVDIHRAAGHIRVVDCYRDLLAEVALGERTHRTDLADLGLGPD